MKSDKKTDRLWVLFLIGLVTVGIVTTHQAEAKEVLYTLERGHLLWVGVAMCLQGIFYCLQALLFWSAFRVVGVQSRFVPLLSIWFRSVFVSTLAPTLGAAVFIQDAAQRRESPVRAVAGTMVVKVVDMGTLLLVVATGFCYLGLRHDLTDYELYASLILALIVSGWAGALLMGLWNPQLLRGLLEGVRRAATFAFRLVKRSPPLLDDWAERSTQELANCTRLIRNEPGRLFIPISIALTAHLIDLVSLYALLHAFHIEVSPGTLVAGFAVGILFWVVSLTPEGIGTVESMMALTFASLGVPLPQATAASLAFRGLAYYLPLIIGTAIAYFPNRIQQGVDSNASSSIC